MDQYSIIRFGQGEVVVGFKFLFYAGAGKVEVRDDGLTRSTLFESFGDLEFQQQASCGLGLGVVHGKT